MIAITKEKLWRDRVVAVAKELKKGSKLTQDEAFLAARKQVKLEQKAK